MDEQKSLKPDTTAQQDITTAGQRKVNLIWENTQSKIALMVIIAGLAVNGAIVMIVVFGQREIGVNKLALISLCLQFINMMAGIVIGFYFSRTNHAAIGGIGSKPLQSYEGR